MHYSWIRTRVLTIIGVCAAQAVSTHVAHAGIVDTYFDPDNTIIGKTQLPDSPPTIIALNVISGFLEVLGLILLIIIIYSGYNILMSRGEADKIKKGKDTIFWAIIGVIIILASLGIVTWLNSVFSKF